MSVSGAKNNSRSALDLVYSLVNPTSEFKRDLAPIILLHGLLGSKAQWKLLMQDLANRTGRKVYALDQRNQGESPWSDEFDLELLSLDLDHFLEQHNIAEAVLVGQSLGAKTVMTFALQKPQKAEKVVFEDMYVKNMDETFLKAASQMFQVMKQIISSATNESDLKTALTMASKSFPHTDSTDDLNIVMDLEVLPIQKEGEHFVWQGNLDVIEKTLHIPGHYNQNLKGEYHGEALFIYGTKSFFDVPSDPTITKFFPRAQLVGIEGASHDVHNLFPEKFMAEVVKFINSEPTSEHPQIS